MIFSSANWKHLGDFILFTFAIKLLHYSICVVCTPLFKFRKLPVIILNKVYDNYRKKCFYHEMNFLLVTVTEYCRSSIFLYDFGFVYIKEYVCTSREEMEGGWGFFTQIEPN